MEYAILGFFLVILVSVTASTFLSPQIDKKPTVLYLSGNSIIIRRKEW